MSENLANKTVIVMGAARGPGLACAQKLAAHGANVLLADADGARGRAAARAMTAKGQNAMFVETDAREAQALAMLAACAASNFGALDIVLSNSPRDLAAAAGIAAMIAAGEAAAREMVRAGHGGVIINIAALDAVGNVPDLLTQAITRASVECLTRTMAAELAPHRIFVNAIAPGGLLSEMTQPGGASAIADLAAYLAVADEHGLTGATFSHRDHGAAATPVAMRPSAA